MKEFFVNVVICILLSIPISAFILWPFEMSAILSSLSIAAIALKYIGVLRWK